MKIRIGLFFGGNSSEHEISIISALQAAENFDKNKYEVIPIYISKDSRFFVGENIGNIDSYKHIDKLMATSHQAAFVKTQNCVDIIIYPKPAMKKQLYAQIDLAFPVVHGTNAEDGTLAGFFELLDIPYSGPNIVSSAVGMDKYLQKIIFKEAGINVLEGMIIHIDEFSKDKEHTISKAVSKFGYPIIVKPNNLGSSIGIKIANDKDALEEALSFAFKFSRKALLERAIKHLKEVNISVLGDDEMLAFSECEEPIGKDEILSFNDKYLSGSKNKASKSSSGTMESFDRRIPADITTEQKEMVRDYAKKAFTILGAAGVSRIDFTIDCDDNAVYLNEINTIPGSLSFYLWEASGLSYKELIDKLIDIALKNYRLKKNLNFSFKSNVLNMVHLGGAKNKLS